jgi:hypothetical protein
MRNKKEQRLIIYKNKRGADKKLRYLEQGLKN